MAKESKGNRKLFILGELFLFIIIFGSVITLFYFRNKKAEEEKVFKNNLNELNEKEEQYKEIQKKLEESLNKLKEYDNLDEKISSTKKDYYNTIKKLEDAIITGNSDKKIAYLTFDDGPYYNTYKVLDILDKYNVKATFFTTNINGDYCFDKKSENCFALYKEYVKRGHTIANHTYTHAIFKGLYSSVDSFINAVSKQQDHIKEQSGGYITNILRFPGGIPTAKAKLGSGGYERVTEKLREMGYGWVDWTSEDGDGKDIQNKQQAWNMLTSTLNDNIEVILFHDYNAITTSLLPEAIEYLQNKGYILLPLFYDSNMINK